MLKRLSSAISTAHAISLAIREAPDAIRTVCDVAKAVIENDNTNYASRKFLKAAFERAKERDEVKRDLDIVEFIANEVWLWSKERITQLQIDVDSLGGALVAEHKIATDYAAEITEARELLSGLSSGLGYGLGGEDESLPSMIERVEDGIRFNLRVMTEQRDAAQNERDALESKLTETERALDGMNRLYDEQCKATIAARENIEGLYTEAAKERDDLRAKLARHEAAERWHQVTAGEGELPPPIPVLWEPNDPENHPSVNYPRVSIPGKCGTYRWRYLSSEDVPQ